MAICSLIAWLILSWKTLTETFFGAPKTHDHMPQSLPEGLVATKPEVRGGLESVDQVDVEDIARLWKGTSWRMLNLYRTFPSNDLVQWQLITPTKLSSLRM